MDLKSALQQYVDLVRRSGNKLACLWNAEDRKIIMCLSMVKEGAEDE
jgi:hypothetical protein